MPTHARFAPAAALLAAAAMLLPGAAARGDGPSVVTSIPPIHSLAANVTEGVTAPHLLVRAGASPHTYQMSPAEAQRLQDADIVFWVGDDLELFLNDAIADIAGAATRTVKLIKLDGLTTYSYRTGGPWDTHDHSQDHNDHSHDHNGQGDAGPAPASDLDSHVWLDPHNARVIVTAMARHLAEMDPANAETYRANAAETRARLDALDATLAETLAEIDDAAYVVFHDAYQYLERRYDLSPVGSVTVEPQAMPGTRRIAELRTRIAELDARCLFVEPQFEPAIVDRLAAETGVSVAVLDPLGAEIPPGRDAYFELMTDMAESLRTCLAG